MSTRCRLRCATLGLSLLLAGLATDALAQDAKPWRYYPGPFTISGRVLYPDGRPAVGYPVKLLPARPEKGADKYNTYYLIPNRNIHATVTDADGRFTMTDVIDYPQVKSHRYRVVRAGAEERFPYDHVAGTDVASLNRCMDPKGRINLTIRFRRCSQAKVVVRDRAGRPLNGFRAISVATEGGRPVTMRFEFKNGVTFVVPHDYEQLVRGRIVLLRSDDAIKAMQEAGEHGDFMGKGKPLSYGAVGQRDVLFIPGKTITVEFTLDQ